MKIEEGSANHPYVLITSTGGRLEIYQISSDNTDNMQASDVSEGCHRMAEGVFPNDVSSRKVFANELVLGVWESLEGRTS